MSSASALIGTPLASLLLATKLYHLDEHLWRLPTCSLEHRSVLGLSMRRRAELSFSIPWPGYLGALTLWSRIVYMRNHVTARLLKMPHMWRRDCISATIQKAAFGSPRHALGLYSPSLANFSQVTRLGWEGGNVVDWEFRTRKVCSESASCATKTILLSLGLWCHRGEPNHLCPSKAGPVVPAPKNWWQRDLASALSYRDSWKRISEKPQIRSMSHWTSFPTLSMTFSTYTEPRLNSLACA